MRSLRILQISSERTWRGGEQQIAYLIGELRTHEAEVHVLARKGSAFVDWCRKEGVPFKELAFTNAFDVGTALSMARYARQHDFDIVHAHSGKGHSLAYMASRLGMGKPLIVHRRVDFSLSASRIKLAKYNHRSVKRILCVSQAIAGMVKLAVQRPQRVHTVYSGIDFDRFKGPHASGFLHRELGIPEAHQLVVMVAALAPHKDYPSYLRAAAEVCKQRDDVHFLAVGEGELRGSLEQLRAQLNLQQRFHFTGFRDDVPAVLREAKLFMLTSKTEGLGTSVIDALHCGLPVVATRAGGIPELVEEGLQGALCNIGDADALARNVLNILGDPLKYRHMSEAAQQRAKEFSSAQMARKVMEHYRAVLAEA